MSGVGGSAGTVGASRRGSAWHVGVVLAALVALASQACTSPDPLPPSPCEQMTAATVANGVDRKANWVIDQSKMVASIQLGIAFGYVGSLSFVSDPAITGATSFHTVRSDSSLGFYFEPSASVTHVDVVVALDCEGTDHRLKLRYDVTGQRSEGAEIRTEVVP